MYLKHDYTWETIHYLHICFSHRLDRDDAYNLRENIVKHEFEQGKDKSQWSYK